jgi:hypothetical protein
LGFDSHLFETNPDQNGTADGVPHGSRFATLISFKPRQLFGFSMKLLDLPAKAAHILYDLQVVLSHLVRNDIIRALDREHYSEQFHLMLGGEPFDFDYLTLL